MPNRGVIEWVGLLLFDTQGRILLRNVENRGLWLPAEPKHESCTLVLEAQKLLDEVSKSFYNLSGC